MSRLKIGVIGCGAIAQIQHFPNPHLRDDIFEIRPLCDLSASLRDARGEIPGVPPARRFLDYRERVVSVVDAVIVCPAGSHASPSIAAARAGKHVFVEKPMCYTVWEAKAMVAAAEESGVVLQVG